MDLFGFGEVMVGFGLRLATRASKEMTDFDRAPERFRSVGLGGRSCSCCIGWGRTRTAPARLSRRPAQTTPHGAVKHARVRYDRGKMEPGRRGRW